MLLGLCRLGDLTFIRRKARGGLEEDEEGGRLV